MSEPTKTNSSESLVPFTPEEMAVVREAKLVFDTTVSTIARLHALTGNVSLHSELKGFIRS